MHSHGNPKCHHKSVRVRIFMQEQISDPQSYGIYIVDRMHRGLDDSINQLAKQLHEFTKMNRRQRIIMRNRTERLSDMLDWKSLGIYYRQARLRALKCVYPDVEVEEEPPKIRYSYP